MNGLVTGPGSSFDRELWAPVEALFDAVWPRLTACQARAAALGAPWAASTTPFVWFEGGRALAHVGVLEHPVRLRGERVVIAGVHAVCAHPDVRRRGHVRALLDAACAWIDDRHALAKLHTALPDVYTRVGFRPVETWGWTTERAGPGGGAARPLDLADAAQLARLHVHLRDRAPISGHHASADPGWLVLIDAAIGGSYDHLHQPPDGAWTVAWELAGDTLRIHELFAPALPTLDTLLAACPWPFRRVEWSTCADLLDPRATPFPRPSGLMVRGPWPADLRVGVSPFAEH